MHVCMYIICVYICIYIPVCVYMKPFLNKSRKPTPEQLEEEGRQRRLQQQRGQCQRGQCQRGQQRRLQQQRVQCRRGQLTSRTVLHFQSVQSLLLLPEQGLLLNL